MKLFRIGFRSNKNLHENTHLPNNSPSQTQRSVPCHIVTEPTSLKRVVSGKKKQRSQIITVVFEILQLVKGTNYSQPYA